MKKLLGIERYYDRKKGFIHIDPEKGVEIKPLNLEDNIDYFYCFDFKLAIKQDGQKEAEKQFKSRLDIIEKNKYLFWESFKKSYRFDYM